MVKELSMNKNMALFLTLCFLITALFSEEIILLGDEDQWEGAYLYNLMKQQGQRGYQDLKVAHKENELAPTSDLLLGFDQSRPMDESNHYRISGAGTIQHRFTRRGSGAALFSQQSPMELQPTSEALFYPGNQWGDFTIQFWMYPTNLREGEILLHWKGFIQGQERMLSQEILCRISDRRLNWDFSNFFLSAKHEESHFQLAGDRLIPRTWSHHMIRFRYETGLLEYLVDGKPAAIIHTTPSGREEINVYMPRIEQTNATPLILGSSFTGFIDEFNINKQWNDLPYLLDYEKPGYYLSPVIDLGYQDSTIQNLEINQQSPGNSRIEYFYYISNLQDEAREQWIQLMDRAHPEEWLENWQPFDPESLSQVPRGQYLLIAALLYPDVGEERSPVLSSIKITYEEHLPPIPPLNLTARSENGKVYLNWDFSENSSIGGFLIYYGERPGQYFGSNSPIRLEGQQTEYILENLEPYKTWYISMVAYNDSTPAQYSDFSREVAIRP